MISYFPKEPVLIAKSCVKLDVKPWDDETDLAEMEKAVRSIEMEGLLWGQCKSNISSTNFLEHFYYIE
jgi:hypothetical protein